LANRSLRVDSQLALDNWVFLGVNPVSDDESADEKGSKKKATAKKKVVAEPERRTDDLLKEEQDERRQSDRRGDSSLVEILQMQKYLQSVLRHIGIVQDACQLLGGKLIENGEVDFGRILIANGLKHDNSKLSGIEWEYLHGDSGDDKLKIAHHQHVTTNPHHPEYWGGVKAMPRIYVAEMVCDLFARSTEFGTDLRQYVKTEFSKRHKLTTRCKEYRMIKGFMDLLLDKPFSKIK